MKLPIGSVYNIRIPYKTGQIMCNKSEQFICSLKFLHLTKQLFLDNTCPIKRKVRFIPINHIFTLYEQSR